MAKEKTRDVLLDAGKKLFLERGYNNSGLEAILQEAGVPKGSFYYFFESKEDFGLRVLDKTAEDYEADVENYLGDVSLRPLDRLKHYFETHCDKLESKQCRNGCLVGNLSQEMADQSELFRTRVGQIFRRRVDRYAACLKEAQDAGEISTELDVRELAEFWLNSWQGAVLRAKTLRDIGPLKTFVKVMFNLVLCRGGVNPCERS